MPALLETSSEPYHKKQTSKGKVLLTGNFEVVVTVRSEEKCRTIVKTLKNPSHRCSFAIVEDIAKEGAYDALFQATADSGGAEKPFDYVVHTASPYQFHVEDPVKDFLDPAIKGTTGLLHSIQAHAPSVRRVVITSSSAAVIDPKSHAKVYDETHWPTVTWEEAMDPKNTYRCSKVFSEKAAWAIANATDPRPKFDLVTLNPTYNFGPIQRGLPRLAAVNASNARIRDLVLGVHGPRGALPGLPPTAPVFTFVDVRDVALAHLRALTVPEAGGQRFYVVGAHFSNQHIAAAVARRFPQLRGPAACRHRGRGTTTCPPTSTGSTTASRGGSSALSTGGSRRAWWTRCAPCWPTRTRKGYLDHVVRHCLFGG
ncbi:NAD(P)-binding protein [Apiospora phragmitis]|uniref:NAD(P)-binding protein n=1 Tax=Apiospora phragmitis TaxID=2905665 RepID=A0ABR1TS42_9PEZI